MAREYHKMCFYASIFYMRFLGIDYGTKRIGLAVSDDNGVLAFPKTIILNDRSSLENILGILKKENISGVVIGESLDFNGNKNKIWQEAEDFIKVLEIEAGVPIHKEKEFLTTVGARWGEGKEKNNARKIKKEISKKIDDSAAALILQRYLDRRSRQKEV